MQDSESIWLERAQKGDGEAFAYLVETYQRPVYNLCYRMLGDSGDAEDAAQETFFRAYRSIKRYDSSRPFPTWLLSIAAHYCIDQLRKRRMNTFSIDEHDYLEIPDDNPGPETTLRRAAERERVHALLTELNPTDRAAVVMYYWYDFSYDEIGEALSLTLSAVKSRLHRARRSMADEWIKQQSQVITREREYYGEQTPAF